MYLLQAPRVSIRKAASSEGWLLQSEGVPVRNEGQKETGSGHDHG